MVGDFNKRVSDIIALNINPAIFFGIVILFSLYISYIIEQVAPKELSIIFTGFEVMKPDDIA